LQGFTSGPPAGTGRQRTGAGQERWPAISGCGTSRAVRHWDRAGARDQKPAAGSRHATDGADVLRRASSGAAERPGGGGRFLTATLDAQVSPSRRALRGRAGAAWMYQWACMGDLLGSKRRSKPSKMSDRTASLRRCCVTASGRESFPSRPDPPGSAETGTTLGPLQSRSPGRWPDTQPQPSSRRSDRRQDRSDQQETNRRRSAASTRRPSIVRTRSRTACAPRSGLRA
jgi:hypothetical protein